MFSTFLLFVLNIVYFFLAVFDPCYNLYLPKVYYISFPTLPLSPSSSLHLLVIKHYTIILSIPKDLLSNEVLYDVYPNTQIQ